MQNQELFVKIKRKPTNVPALSQHDDARMHRPSDRRTGSQHGGLTPKAVLEGAAAEHQLLEETDEAGWSVSPTNSASFYGFAQTIEKQSGAPI